MEELIEAVEAVEGSGATRLSHTLRLNGNDLSSWAYPENRSFSNEPAPLRCQGFFICIFVVQFLPRVFLQEVCSIRSGGTRGLRIPFDGYLWALQFWNRPTAGVVVVSFTSNLLVVTRFGTAALRGSLHLWWPCGSRYGCPLQLSPVNFDLSSDGPVPPRSTFLLRSTPSISSISSISSCVPSC